METEKTAAAALRHRKSSLIKKNVQVFGSLAKARRNLNVFL